jgi:hypothetical protein
MKARRSLKRKLKAKANHQARAPAQSIDAHTSFAKIKTRSRIPAAVPRRDATYAASSKVDWIVSDRSHPGERRCSDIKTLAKVFSLTEYADRCWFETRYDICSAALDIDRLANGVHGHLG